MALLMHHQQAVSVVHCIAQIVGYHNGSQILFPYNAVCELHDGFCGFWVQCSRVLIQDQKFDRSHGGHKQRHGLALAAGENAYLYIHLIFQSQTQCAEAFTVKIDPLFIFSGAQIKKFALLSANAMFSAIVIEGQVPIAGFW